MVGENKNVWRNTEVTSTCQSNICMPVEKPTDMFVNWDIEGGMLSVMEFHLARNDLRLERGEVRKGGGSQKRGENDRTGVFQMS